MATALPHSPRAACLAAARRAEQVHGLPQGLLVAVALSESGLHAHALSIGGRASFPEDLSTARRLLAQTPARQSVMAGCVQVNARVHARGSDWPLDPVRATDWAGGLLRRWYTETGTWEEAIRRWHGGSPASSQRVVCRVRAKLEVTAPGSTLLRGQPCRKAEAMQARRNGATLLEVAEMQDRAD
ncbi:transglycosylase [Belnapia sp. T18]|uniref:Transglycosylase n=1 Tax=Belnapia arida TaxID=2804533 RepID=A0ABS1U7N2_9PROT|nr:transglycosylase [Belnapia arida]